MEKTWCTKREAKGEQQDKGARKAAVVSAARSKEESSSRFLLYSSYVLPGACLTLSGCCLCSPSAGVSPGASGEAPALRSEQRCYHMGGSVPPESQHTGPLLVSRPSTCFLVSRNRYGLAPGREGTDATGERKRGQKAEVNRSHEAWAVILGSVVTKRLRVSSVHLPLQSPLGT